MAIDETGKPEGPLVGAAASPPRVLVLSELRLLRDGVALALRRESSVQVVGAGSLSMTAQQIADLRPDILLLDVTLPGSLDRSSAVRAGVPAAKIVALGAAETDAVLMKCAETGVAGFVAPSGSISDVVAAIHSAMRGELVCSPRTAGLLLSHVSALAARPPQDIDKDALTQREKEIAQLVGEGLSNKQIALALGIQNPTVKNHVHSILGKLNMQRRIEIAAKSARFGVPVVNFSLLRLRSSERAVQGAVGMGPDQPV